jgi:hypothetical protein
MPNGSVKAIDLEIFLKTKGTKTIQLGQIMFY